MDNIQLAILSSEALIIALLLLFLFQLRSRFGLSPLYITLGVFQPIQAILASTFYVEILPGVIVSPGSAIMFTASLFVILLVYIFEDAIETRKAIYGIMFANLAMALLLYIFGMQLELLNTVNFLNLSREVLNENAKIMLIGTSVFFVDSVLLILAYEAVWKLLTKNLFLRIYLTITLILIFDSLVFVTGVFYQQPNYFSILISGIIGKIVMTAFYAFSLMVYLRFAESSNHKAQSFLDIFHLLSYRQKFEIVHQRGQQTEALLRESEGKYQTLARVSPVGIFRTDINGITTYVNPKWCEISGISCDQALGDGWLDAVHPNDRERIRTGWQEATQRKKESSADYRFMRPDGSIAWVMGRAVPELDSGNQVIGYVGTITDITKRKQAEDEMRISELKFSKAFRSSPDSITLSEMVTGRLVEVNDGFQRVFGYSREEAVGRTTVELGLYKNLADREKMIQTLDEEGSVQNLELTGCHKSGSELIAQLSMEKIEIGGVLHLVTVTRDITERIQMEERMQKQLQRLEALHRIDDAITAGLDMNVSLGLLLEQILSILEVDAATILLFEPDTHFLVYATGRGFHSDAIQGTKLHLGEGHAGRAALEKRNIHIPDLTLETDELARTLSIAGERFKSYFAVPLIVKGQVKGILEIFHRSSLNLDSEWANFAETMANQAAITIEDAQLVNELRRSNKELAVAYDATIEGWSRALDLRDRETEGHTRRVAEKALALARQMGLPDSELVHIRRGALLHDIGKLGVPDKILLKDGSLTDAEWEIMRKHPTFAYDMLSPIQYLKSAGIDIPYSHHEKWDGSGYPRGLKGEDIPLAARIFSVVDVWDALSSDRPYRDAWPPEKVFEHIRKSAGSHFDPDVVEIFLKMIS